MKLWQILVLIVVTGALLGNIMAIVIERIFT